MSNNFAFFFIPTLMFPAVAWACPSSPEDMFPTDFLVLGVTAAVGYRLLLQWKLKLSDQMNMAIYFSCLLASFGAGVLVTGHFMPWPGPMGYIGICLALMGASYPKHWFVRLVVLGSVLGMAIGASFMLFDSH